MHNDTARILKCIALHLLADCSAIVVDELSRCPCCCCALRRRGEKFDRQRHECGTEVKAITYSAMQIREAQGDAEVFVIVDI